MSSSNLAASSVVYSIRTLGSTVAMAAISSVIHGTGSWRGFFSFRFR
jgi:hypothetical protein